MKQTEEAGNGEIGESQQGTTDVDDTNLLEHVQIHDAPKNDAEIPKDVIESNPKGEDNVKADSEGGKFDDALDASLLSDNGKRERTAMGGNVTDGEPELSRPRTMEDDPRQAVLDASVTPSQSALMSDGASAPPPLVVPDNVEGMQTEAITAVGGHLPSNVAVGGNALYPQAHPPREMQFSQLGMNPHPENSMMSQHLLNQQFLMANQGQLPRGFGGNPVSLGQFGMGSFNGPFPGGGAQQGTHFGQVNAGTAPGQPEGGQPPGSDPNGTANGSSQQQQQQTQPNVTGNIAPGTVAPGTGGPVGQMSFGGFANRPGGLLPVMAFGGMPGTMAGNMPDAALQQMMFNQRRGLTEADAMRQRMMLAGIPPPVPGGFRPSFLAAPGGRLNNLSADLRVMTSIPNQTPSVSLALACDDEHLSEYQIMVRKQLEVFEAHPEDVESNTQGRKKQVSLGQVGIRCKHCAALPLRQRGRGAVYYPAKLQGVYQAAQNMASSHLCESCQCIDEPLKSELRTLRERRDTASGGKQYWADGARALGLFEANDGLRLNREQQQQ